MRERDSRRRESDETGSDERQREREREGEDRRRQIERQETHLECRGSELYEREREKRA